MFKLDENELEFVYSTSSGPGGQHVNKTSTKVTVLLNVSKSPSLKNWQKKRINTKLAGRISKDGTLRVSCQESRSQKTNKDIATRRLKNILQIALQKPKKRKKTRPPRWVNEKRIQRKKKRGQKKKLRQDVEKDDYL